MTTKNHKQKILEALNLRQALYDYTQAAKAVDSSIYQIEIERYSPTSSRTIADFSLWKEWTDLATELTITKMCTSKCDWNNNIIETVDKFRKKLKTLYMETITETLYEILLVDLEVTELNIGLGGIDLGCNGQSWGMQNPTRYKIPDDITKILVRENPIMNFDFVAEVFSAWCNEIGYINCLEYGDRPPTIYINMAR